MIQVALTGRLRIYHNYAGTLGEPIAKPACVAGFSIQTIIRYTFNKGIAYHYSAKFADRDL